MHDEVARALGAWVLGGRYAPGELLPREDDLAAALGVGRGSVREAVKTLAAKGLLETRPRVGVRVRAREDWRLLDPAVLAWHPDISRDCDLLAGLIEARRVIEPAAAELAARRATAADLAAIEAAYLAMRAAVPGDPPACREADLAFHAGIVAASRNLVLKGLIGPIAAALRAVFAVTNRTMMADSPALAAHGEVLERIRLRDPVGARLAMERLLDLASEGARPGG